MNVQQAGDSLCCTQDFLLSRDLPFGHPAQWPVEKTSTIDQFFPDGPIRKTPPQRFDGASAFSPKGNLDSGNGNSTRIIVTKKEGESLICTFPEKGNKVRTKDLRPHGIVLQLVKHLYFYSSWSSQSAARHEGVDVGHFHNYPLQASILPTELDRVSRHRPHIRNHIRVR
jgi:hypothetical protein